MDLISGTAKTYASGGNGKGTNGEIPGDIADVVEEYRGKLIEFAAEADESLLEKYLEGGELSSEEIVQGLKMGVLEGSFLPAFCGCGVKNIGTDEFLNGMVQLGASPAERTPPLILSQDGEESRLAIARAGLRNRVLASVYYARST